MSTRVVNLADETELIYGDITPKEAVRNAYAQYTRKDWNTWNYAKYDHLVTEGKHSFACGDWAALKK